MLYYSFFVVMGSPLWYVNITISQQKPQKKEPSSMHTTNLAKFKGEIERYSGHCA